MNYAMMGVALLGRFHGGREFSVLNDILLSTCIGLRVCRRYMFAVGGLLSIIQAGGVLLMPPSPRFYVLRGKYAQVSLTQRNTRVMECLYSERSILRGPPEFQGMKPT